MSIARPKPLDPERDMASLFGARVRANRLRRGYTQMRLATETSYAAGYVGLVENGIRRADYQFAVSCDKVLDTDGELATLWPMLYRGKYPSWFKGFVELEASAVAHMIYEPQVVSGLLQTEPYTRALIMQNEKLGMPMEEIEEQVELRMRRQHILTREDPPELSIILDESVLHRPIGSAQVLREQLTHLIHLANRPRTFIQVLPLSAGAHLGVWGPLRIFTLPRGHDVIYVESYGGGQVFTRRELVNECIVRFDQLRAMALSAQASLALIQQAMENT